MGRYVVSPATHPTDAGRFRASVAVSSGSGAGTHHRVLRLPGLFASPEVARLLALTQGWIHTQGLQATA